MKIESIQHLRAFAAIYVVLFHVGGKFPTSIFSHGGSGVALFFAISGFIIAYVHGQDRGMPNGLIYCIKRVFRIFPPYLPALLIMLVLFLATGTGSSMQRDPVNIVRNILLIHTPSESILSVAWTLVYEMYFYVMFGLFYIFLRLRASLFLLIMITPVFISQYFDFESTKSTVWGSSLMLLFIGGSIIGFWHQKIPRIKTQWLYVPFLAAFVAAPLFHCPWYIFYIIIFGCLIAAVSSESESKFFSYLGNASYSIYLVHIIFISVFKHLITSRSWLDFVVIFSVSLIFSLAYYEFVEKRLGILLLPTAQRLKAKVTKILFPRYS